VNDLANASENEVLKTWEGLGYYSRARNLHAGAKYIVDECHGVFPGSYDSLLKVKGIGPYTAAAISSICFDLPTPVLDGNVYRVIARLFGIFDDIAKSSTRKVFIAELEKIIPHNTPGDFNQAIMELGATVCTPQSPHCGDCPISAYCFALKSDCQGKLPVKVKKVKVKDRFFHYLVLEENGRFGLSKRKPGDVWQGLYDFHCEEVKSMDDPPKFESLEEWSAVSVSSEYIHVLTHQRIHAHFHHLQVASEKIFEKIAEDLQLDIFSWADIVALPKPRLIVNYLNEHEF
jgi:A/G-specific adenine glycosylase